MPDLFHACAPCSELPFNINARQTKKKMTCKEKTVELNYYVNVEFKENLN